MRTVTLEVASREAVTRRTLAAFGERKQGAYLSFATPELLWSVLTAWRRDILRAMAGAGSMSIRDAARRVRRAVKAVQGECVHCSMPASCAGPPMARSSFRMMRCG